MQKLHPVFQNRCIGSEEPENVNAEHIEKDRHDDGHNRCLHHTGGDSLVDTVDFSGAVILPDKGGGGDAHGAQHHPEQAVDLSVCGPGRHHIGAQAIDAHLHDDVGDRIHDGLKTGRKTDFDDAKQHFRDNFEFFQFQAVDVIGADQCPKDQDGAEKLGQDRGQPGAEYIHVQSQHKGKVQHDIGHTGCDQVIKRTFGISDGTQDTGSHII